MVHLLHVAWGQGSRRGTDPVGYRPLTTTQRLRNRHLSDALLMQPLGRVHHNLSGNALFTVVEHG